MAERRGIADGASIRAYVEDAARAYGIDQKIRFHHKVVRAAWSSADARWTVDATRTDTGEAVQLTCDFLFLCSGYYAYDAGYAPDFPGADTFAAASSTPSAGPTTSTTTASAWS